MIKILFMAADPTDASRLRLGEELREIQEKLQLSKTRDAFELHQRISVRAADITQALLDINPDIVHFSGHGTSTGALCIEDKLGEMHPVLPDTLAELFEQFVRKIKCVVLNACYSEKQAEAIVKHIPYVIGMSQAISDRVAIAFSGGFYKALGGGRTIEDAYRLGCVQIRLGNSLEQTKPVLMTKKGWSDGTKCGDSKDSAMSSQPTVQLPMLPFGDVMKLRQSEKVDALIAKGKYEEALKLDPQNVIAVMRYIESLTAKRQYQKATELYQCLAQSNVSGVGYSTYPILSLAFHKIGDSSNADKILDELEKAIQEDLNRGFGYLSRSEQLRWLQTQIGEAMAQVKDTLFASRLGKISQNIESIIVVLSGSI